jgi:protein-tyrosine phosphatase
MKRLYSFALIIQIFILKTLDSLHRFAYGIPIISRSQITSNLYLGSQYNLIGLQKLKALGVTAIVNMRMHSVYSESVFEGIVYLHLPTIDNTAPTLADLIAGTNFMDGEIKKGGIVYVHCRQGLGRGPTMAIAYLMKIGATLEDAYRLVKIIRPFILLKQCQLKQLEKFEVLVKKSK